MYSAQLWKNKNKNKNLGLKFKETFRFIYIRGLYMFCLFWGKRLWPVNTAGDQICSSNAFMIPSTIYIHIYIYHILLFLSFITMILSTIYDTVIPLSHYYSLPSHLQNSKYRLRASASIPGTVSVSGGSKRPSHITKDSEVCRRTDAPCGLPALDKLHRNKPAGSVITQGPRVS